MRFHVRKSVSELGPALWRIWDSTQRQFVFTTTREALAENCARRFEQAAVAELFGAADGSWR